ncbi:MAG: hypothetical protein GY719_40800 [bacterium]|nr:hypothetical protein [bacterium]
MRQLSGWLIVAALLASTPAAASCPELPAVPETDGVLRSYIWAFQDKGTSVGLTSSDLIYGKGDVPYYVHRVCDGKLGKPYVNSLSRIDVVPDALFARVTEKAASFLYYESTEFLGHKEAGKAKLTAPELGYVQAKPLGEEHVELRFREPVELVQLGAGQEHEPIRATLAVIATSHALALAPLVTWSLDWKKNSIDSRIDLQVIWVKISKDVTVSRGSESRTLAELSDFGRQDIRTVAKLDKKNILKKLAAFLKGYPVEELDYVVLLKDSWDVTARGLGPLSEELDRLPSGVVFDVLSTRTVTESAGYLKGLTAERGGRYFESDRNNELHIVDQDIGGRILGKVRARVRSEAVRRGIPIDESSGTVDRLTVRVDDSYFEVGNLVTVEHLEKMKYVLRLGLCLAKRGSVSSFEVEARLARAGLIFQPEDQMRPLFRHWFRGFDLPPSSPIARDTPQEMIRRAASDTGVKRYLEEVAAQIETLLQSNDSCATFVPSRTFQPREAGK